MPRQPDPTPSPPPTSSQQPERPPAPLAMDSGAEFRLGRTLYELRQKEGSYAALARAITRAFRESSPAARVKGDVIDRRKLKSLVEGGKGAVLTLGDLFALDPYLSKFGESLALRPILQKPDLMEALADSGRVTFLLGSRPETERRMVSEYDLLGAGEIQRAISNSHPAVRFEVTTVPMTDNVATRDDVRSFEALLHEENGPSLVVLASPRSNPFAELLLCTIFGFPPFAERPLPPGVQPPFQLVWNPRLPHLYESHFCADPRALLSRDTELAREVAEGKASVLLTRDDSYADRVTPRRWGETYGVCVAQRRRRGQVWLLLLGITGAATFACAKLANGLATRIGEVPDGQESDIYWGIVEASIDESQQSEFFDLRQFAGEKITTQTPLSPPE